MSGRSRPDARGVRRSRSEGLRGFTLIEALVALAIVAAVLGSIGSAIATTVRGTRGIDERLAMAETAQGLLAGLSARENLKVGRQTGRSGGFLWRIDVAPLPLGAGANAGRWQPVAVDIRVLKPDGGAMQMKTVRLVPQAAS